MSVDPLLVVSWTRESIHTPVLVSRDVTEMSTSKFLFSRLGTTSKMGVCGTCGEKMTECVGHWGYVRLALPVFHIGYFREVIRILQCICKVSLLFRPLDMAVY
jgi:DNA-directed RNA polymerase beta' subunit